jgi:hypothetical protein
MSRQVRQVRALRHLITPTTSVPSCVIRTLTTATTNTSSGASTSSSFASLMGEEQKAASVRVAAGRTAAIVGASIGGLTAAHAFLRLGMNVRVMERRREADIIGNHSLVVLTPNAMTSLNHIDTRLAAIVQRVATVVPAAHILTPAGRQLRTLSSSHVEANWKYPLLAVTQGALAEALLTCLPPPGNLCRVEFNRKFIRFEIPATR